MNKLFLTLICFSYFFNGIAQNIVVTVKDEATNTLLVGAIVSIVEKNIHLTSDSTGIVALPSMPYDQYTIQCSYIGYQTYQQRHYLPSIDGKIEIRLTPKHDELDEIIIEGTRSNRSIENIPTRVEVLTEEIDEASTMDPSKIAHLITHSTGIQVQQTSATSNTANVRIQGLDGRYTQILKDGFPLYGGFSGSLSIMQIPPLDLRQVEYIKGGASTLYGGGAIAGIINLLSKEPQHDESLIHVNVSHIGAFDVNTFVSRSFQNTGFTLLAQRNTHSLFDADADGYSDMPQLTKYNINPKMFFSINQRLKLQVGATITNETKQGGNIHVIESNQADSSHFYHESNDINRFTTQIKLDYFLLKNRKVEFRNSFNFFQRSLNLSPIFNAQYRFAGKQTSSFSEIAYSSRKNKNGFISGLNFYTDNFIENTAGNDTLRTENYTTVGFFANYVFDMSKKIAVESGIRTDYVTTEKLQILPRVSLLFRWTEKLTSRIGAGMGYRNASIFNQEAEMLAYHNILSIDRSKTEAEQSYGANVDIGYKTPLGENFFLIINQMLFYSHLQSPLVLHQVADKYEFVNANGYTRSIGAETFFKLGFYDFVWFVGYTYTNATNYFDNKSSVLSLTPQHSIKGDILYALPKKWRIGFDYEYKSQQTLSNGQLTPSYWTTGAVVEYTYNMFTFFGNIENFADIRQTRYGSLLSLPYNTPQFTEVWAPLDGFVFNMGIKIRFSEQ